MNLSVNKYDFCTTFHFPRTRYGSK